MRGAIVLVLLLTTPGVAAAQDVPPVETPTEPDPEPDVAVEAPPAPAPAPPANVIEAQERVERGEALFALRGRSATSCTSSSWPRLGRAEPLCGAAYRRTPACHVDAPRP